MIDINDLGKTEADRRKFEETALNNIGDELFQLTSFRDIAFNVLIQIDPIYETLENTDDSVEEHCKMVLQHYGLPLKVTVTDLMGNGRTERKPQPKTSLNAFMEWILNIIALPSDIYNEIFPLVSKDLKKITELISWYEKQPSIIHYIKNNEVPKNHLDRITFDFYKRCQRERELILNYYFFGIKDRVRNKCKRHFRFMISEPEIFRDLPYSFEIRNSIRYYDCRLLDQTGHRLMNFGPKPYEEMERLYYSDKREFYQRYFKRNPLKKHFESISYFMPYIPFKNNRKIIFNELKDSFEKENWINFFALALPQVEGLFSEMTAVVFPKQDLSQKALPHKVDILRPHYVLSRPHFDYFQYQIPILRNRFSHTGYDEDLEKDTFKLKSYDLLLDLCYLLQVFAELENPLIRLKRLLTRKSINDFVSIPSIANYISLLQNIDSDQYETLKKEIIDFESDFLINGCSLNYQCEQIVVDFQNKLDILYATINEYVISEDKSFDLRTITRDRVIRFCQQQRVASSLDFVLINLTDEIALLEDYLLIVSGHQKNLPSLDQHLKKEFNKIRPVLAKPLHMIKEIRKLLGRE